MAKRKLVVLLDDESADKLSEILKHYNIKETEFVFECIDTAYEYRGMIRGHMGIINRYKKMVEKLRDDVEDAIKRGVSVEKTREMIRAVNELKQLDMDVFGIPLDYRFENMRLLHEKRHLLEVDRLEHKINKDLMLEDKR